MTRSRHIALLAALVVAISACGGGTAAQAHVGQPAPQITGTALDGTQVDLAKYRGRPVIVNFWASWCVPCREEFPLFKERLASLGASDGLAVLGVLYKDEPALAQKFITDAGATWPTVPDPGDATAAAYRVVAPPQTYFIDKDGVVRGIQIGQVKPEDFDTQYAKIKP
jgi:cytochrome c biogenesis protein CcmG, thiol:disulfide interchange protein DsbE